VTWTWLWLCRYWKRGWHYSVDEWMRVTEESSVPCIVNLPAFCSSRRARTHSLRVVAYPKRSTIAAKIFRFAETICLTAACSACATNSLRISSNSICAGWFPNRSLLFLESPSRVRSTSAMVLVMAPSVWIADWIIMSGSLKTSHFLEQKTAPRNCPDAGPMGHVECPQSEPSGNDLHLRRPWLVPATYSPRAGDQSRDSQPVFVVSKTSHFDPRL